MYLLYTTSTSFVIKREEAPDRTLTIDRSDNGHLEIKGFAEVSNLHLSTHYRILYCILGIVRIAGESYLVVATQATNVATVDDAHILKITETDFISFKTGLGSKFQGKENEETAFYQMQLLLNSGHFYFSSNTSYDITQNLQNQSSASYSKRLPIWERADLRFFWNKFIQRDFISNQLDDWCTPTIMGFVETKSCGQVCGKLLEIVIISRRSRFRAGTRYNTRGVDDDGNVANFVETEQIVNIGKYTLAFVQIRGSVPVFWEQLAPQVGKFSDIKFSKISEIGKIATKVTNKIQICRTAQSTTHAAQKHFKYLIGQYGDQICLNLLSTTKSGEKLLTEAFEQQLKGLSDPAIRYVYFDYNESIKGSKMDKLDSLIYNILDTSKVGHFTRDPQGVVVRRQRGVIRTNCKDCLDRTNVVQTRIAWRVLDLQLRSLDLLQSTASLENYPELGVMFKTIWANSGDELSLQYAGSGSLKSNLTRTGQSTIMGLIDDGKKSVTRFYMNNFRDSARQEGIDQLVGLHHAVKVASQAEMNVQKLMAARASEFTQTIFGNVFVGTFNVGGNDPGYEPLDAWLDPRGELPDIYAIGIQEVVELTPGKILATDPERARIWENELRKTLLTVCGRYKSKEGYIQIQSHQLVGLLMCVYVKDSVLASIRDVQYEITKVGLKGMAGNKGGIAVSLVYGNTPLCFVTAHLAAGQSNIEDRNRDYLDINENTAFGRQRQLKILDHAHIFWFGDFNYRVDLPDEEVRRHLSENNLDSLLANDQLYAAKNAGLVFHGFQEGPLNFQPTYKYDLHTQIYDTSPKSRAPAWTDRILWKTQAKVELKFYGRTELTLSDHRPVAAYFRVEVKKTDKEKERQLRRMLVTSRSPLNGADVNSPDIITWDEPAAPITKPASLISVDFDIDFTQNHPVAPVTDAMADLQFIDLAAPAHNTPLHGNPFVTTNNHSPIQKKLPPLPAVPTPTPYPILASTPTPLNAAPYPISNPLPPHPVLSFPPPTHPPTVSNNVPAYNPFVDNAPHFHQPSPQPIPAQSLCNTTFTPGTEVHTQSISDDDFFNQLMGRSSQVTNHVPVKQSGPAPNTSAPFDPFGNL